MRFSMTLLLAVVLSLLGSFGAACAETAHPLTREDVDARFRLFGCRREDFRSIHA